MLSMHPQYPPHRCTRSLLRYKEVMVELRFLPLRFIEASETDTYMEQAEMTLTDRDILVNTARFQYHTCFKSGHF